MFSGIVQAVGRVGTIEQSGGNARLDIDSAALGLEDVQIGDSIAVAGVCLTVVSVVGSHFAADLSGETLARTTLGMLAAGDPVNLEKSLRLADRIGGHLVSGHIDGVGKVLSVVADGAAQRWTFAAPPALARYIASKGSIAIDGTSLTVNAVAGNDFDVTLIPHTLSVTTFGARKAGDAVNLEVDLVARYLERLYLCDRDDSDGD